jgi:hypothetical protein
MGKKNKKQLESTEEVVQEVTTSSELPLIPQETKEATLALLTLLFFSCLMFTLPFGVFYVVQHYIKENFDWPPFQVTCWSVLSAVFTVNIVIGLYVWVAWRDAKDDEAKSRAILQREKTN